MRFRKLIALVVFISWPTLSLAAVFTGEVVAVIDGDTIEVLHNQHTERIRLNGIDCPEKGQAYGHKAKDAVADLIFGKEVTLKPMAWTNMGAR